MRRLALAAIAVCVLLPVAEASAARRVPPSFIGAVLDGPALDGAYADLPGEFAEMVATGVESVRVVVDWRSAQPYASFADVPVADRPRYRDEGGVPTDYGAIDAVIQQAAQRHMTVLPVVIIAPPWAARHPGNEASPPRDPAPYARFVAALARRYGPNGAFWSENPTLPRRPLRLWQVWNEPSFPQFWSDQPFVRDYVELLRATRREVKAADRGAKIVLAGFPNRSWTNLRAVYRRGGRRLFDIVAVHPFTGRVAGVVTIVERNRAVMRRFGDARKPLMVTELSWTSALGRTEWSFGNETTEAGQARKLRAGFRLLARERRRLRIKRAYWYTWLSEDADRFYPFDYAGLGRVMGERRIVRKPAFQAMRRTALALEGCREKRDVADRCAR